MEKDRKTKVLSIVALVLAIFSMSLGFAAFSTTLNIASSATVTPNSEDFKISVYGMTEEVSTNILSLTDVFKEENYTEKNSAAPVFPFRSSETIPDNYTIANITGDSQGITIDNMSFIYTRTTDSAHYPFLIRNEGKYDVYLKLSEEDDSECTSTEEMTESMLAACENFGIIYWLRDINVTKIEDIEQYAIKPGEYMFAMLEWDYIQSNNVWPDGPIEYKPPTLKVTFSTTK